MFPSSEGQKNPADVQGRQWGALTVAIFTSTHLFRDHFEGIQLWLTRWKCWSECRILAGQHKHKPQVQVLGLSLPCSQLISSPARGKTCAWCRCWNETLLALSCCCFFALGWFLTNVCGMHNQHLGGAAGGKRKLTRNINSQIFECPSVAALLALGRSLQTAGKPRPSCVVCKGGTLGDIAQVSKAKNE